MYIYIISSTRSIGGSGGGGARDVLPPTEGPTSFIFMQFSAKYLQNNRILVVGTPRQENSGSATASDVWFNNLDKNQEKKYTGLDSWNEKTLSRKPLTNRWVGA